MMLQGPLATGGLRFVWACLFLLTLGGCWGGNRPQPSAAQAGPMAGHQQMLDLLREIAEATPYEHPHLGKVHVQRLRQRLRQIQSLQQVGKPVEAFERWQLLFNLGKAEVRLGDVREGIDHLREAYDLLPDVSFNAVAVRESWDVRLGSQLEVIYANHTRFFLGLAYLLLGEKQNCCLRHNAESSIMPIRGGGLHTEEDGSREASRYFLEILDNAPADLDEKEQLEIVDAAQWLLNVAQMTLGQYPDGVPEPYRAPRDLFNSSIDFPRFRNVAPLLGLDTFSLCGGAVVDDFDGDDDLDIVTTNWDTAGQMRLFVNNGDGSFTDRTQESGLEGFFGGLNLVHADYDNDGDNDLYVLRGAWLRSFGRHPNSLLENNGRGQFTDVTFAAGLGDHHYPCKTAAWGDYDNDGDLDLYVGNESTTDVEAPCQLFRNNGDGTFIDMANRAGLGEKIFAMGAVWGDYDGDRFPDLYVSTGFSDLRAALAGGGPNRLYHNQRDGTFRDVAEEMNVTLPICAFASWFWDFDNDGFLDIYSGCSSGPVGVLVSDQRFGLNCLHRGNGGKGFEEVALDVGLDYPAQPMGANFGDLNNDGYLDFYLATGNMQYSELRPNVMFLNEGGRKFINITMAGGFGHLQKGHGVCFADLDNDGDQDIYMELGGAWPGDKYYDVLYENPGFGNHWLGVKLEGRTTNRSAIGARIRVRIREADSTREIFRHVNSGGSFGCNPLRQHLGLGQADQIEELEVYWPTSDTKQLFREVALDQTITIIEGESEFKTMPLRQFRFPE